MLIALAGAAHADVKITDAYATDRNGVRVTPRVGEPFFVTVTLNVGAKTAPYGVTVDTPAGTLEAKDVRFGIATPGNYWLRQGEVTPLFDGPMDITVSCSAAKKPLKLRIVPTSPASAIQVYAPQRLQGRFGASAQLDCSTARLLAWLPLPQTSGAQVVESTDAPAKMGMSRENGQTIGLVDSLETDGIDVAATCTITSGSVRSNLAALRAVPMSAVKPGDWLAPEARVQSDHKEIVSFARSATRGANAKTPVADVALSIYSAILKRSTYAKTGELPDALKALRNGKGECGDLSALFVATCRAAGVPARTVSGFCMGNDQWHVWAEFLVPSVGWVPVDPAFAAGARPRSAAPIYFGVIPEMRSRVALCYGFTHSLGSESTSFLQTPQIFTFESGLKIRSARFWSSLESANLQP